MAKRTPKWETVKELRQIVKNHPESEPAQAERSLEELKAQLRLDREPILRDLRAAGITVESLYELKEPYPNALPILLNHLSKFDSYDRRTRISIAHKLNTKDMKRKFLVLLEAFRKDPDHSLNGPQWVLGNAIEELYDDRYAAEVAALALDTVHGEARSCLINALAKSKKEIARTTLKRLRSDPVVAKWVAKIEGNRKKRRLRSRERRKATLAGLRTGQRETSMNFDVARIQEVLKAVATRLRKDFGNVRIKNIVSEIQEMEPEERMLIEVQVRPGWRSALLQILIHKCDEDAADLLFYSKRSIINLIDEVLEEFQ